MNTATEKDLEVAIIGAGFSGLGMAFQLRESGETNFLVFERDEDVGGTWLTNKYPGAGCDIESNLYSFSYAQNNSWTRKFAKRDEIHKYLKDCAENFGVMPFIRCGHELLNATWNEDSSRWMIETSQGHFTAKALIAGTGYLSEPQYPNIAGLDQFKGTTLHTAKWDENFSVEGKRVAIIGTGASTVQIVPSIQPLVAKLDVYQRSAGWVVPKPDKINKGFAAWATKNVPGYHWLQRQIAFWNSESHIWFLQSEKRMGIPQKEATQHLEKQVTDPVLKEKLTPDHVVGCKRFLFSDEFYPALQQPNVELITDGIKSISEKGVITSDGVEREVDLIICATGYKPTESPFAKRVMVNGQSLSQAWADGQFAYLGTSVPGFPNFFLLLGPNSAVAHTSATLISEAQVDYVMKGLKTIKENGFRSVEVKPDVVAKYNAELQKMIAKGVWSAGCTSWYIDDKGNNTAVWPFSTPTYKKRSKHFNTSDYRTVT